MVAKDTGGRMEEEDIQVPHIYDMRHLCDTQRWIYME